MYAAGDKLFVRAGKRFVEHGYLDRLLSGRDCSPLKGGCICL